LSSNETADFTTCFAGTAARRRSRMRGRCPSLAEIGAMNVDCTPGEARLFLGLPDMKPMQEALLEQLQRHLSRNLQLSMDPETILKTWLPANWLPAALKGFEHHPEIFSRK
jgi:hypothetical protein